MGGSPNGNLAPLKVSTSDLPERDRLPFWRDFFSQKIVVANIDLLSTLPLRAEVTLYALPGMRIMWSDLSTPMRGERTQEMVSQGDDSISIIVKQDGLFTIRQRGFEVSPGAGEAFGVLHAEPACMMTSEARYTGFLMPRDTLAPLVEDIEDRAMRPISKNNEALRLLVQYASTLRAEAPLTTPELCHLASAHIRDLIAIALGATRDGAVIANAGGVRAARLKAIKADILKNLASPGLAISEVGCRQHVTPRYIQMLFESEGVTFSEFVCEQRLRRAYSMLLQPRFCDKSVTAIAFAAGFSDLSYFNRCFRRRFRAAPSELRRDVCRAHKSDAG
jgi:AraC-like DNA-binding protein